MSGRGTTPGRAPTGMSAMQQAEGLEVQRQLASSEKHKRFKAAGAHGGGIDYSHPVQQKRWADAIAKRKKRSAQKIQELRDSGVDTQGMSSKDISKKHRAMKRAQKNAGKKKMGEMAGGLLAKAKGGVQKGVEFAGGLMQKGKSMMDKMKKAKEGDNAGDARASEEAAN